MTAKKGAAVSEEQAFKALGKALGTKGPAVAALSLKDLCKLYDKIKGPLQLVLPWIEKVPLWGKRVADAIRILMRLAETACAN